VTRCGRTYNRHKNISDENTTCNYRAENMANGKMMLAVNSPETLLHLYQNARRHIPSYNNIRYCVLFVVTIGVRNFSLLQHYRTRLTVTHALSILASKLVILILFYYLE
jgi:hypothetical protein